MDSIEKKGEGQRQRMKPSGGTYLYGLYREGIEMGQESPLASIIEEYRSIFRRGIILISFFSEKTNPSRQRIQQNRLKGALLHQRKSPKQKGYCNERADCQASDSLFSFGKRLL